MVRFVALVDLCCIASSSSGPLLLTSFDTGRLIRKRQPRWCEPVVFSSPCVRSAFR